MEQIKVKGMSCNHCKMSVTNALKSIDGIQDVQVDLETGNVKFEQTKPVDRKTVEETINRIGFTVEQ